MAATLFRSPHLSSARFADKPEDFAKLGIQPGRIEAFEDGYANRGRTGRLRSTGEHRERRASFDVKHGFRP